MRKYKKWGIADNISIVKEESYSHLVNPVPKSPMTTYLYWKIEKNETGMGIKCIIIIDWDNTINFSHLDGMCW